MDSPIELGSIANVRLWFADLSATVPTAAMWDVLSADERARAERFHFDRDRNRFVARRRLLREILAPYLQTSPAQVVFEVQAYGKPAVRSGVVQFSLSHSQGNCLIAVSSEPVVGVDLECPRPIDELAEIAERYFPASRREAVLARPEHERLVAFLEAWTQIEACLKAAGCGLSLPIDRIVFEPDAGAPVEARVPLGADQGACRFRLFPVEVPGASVAHLAIAVDD